MAIFKFSNASGFGTYTRYNDFLAGNPATPPDTGSMFPLGVFTLSSAQTTVTFTNIPQIYTHLQIRANYVCSNTAGTIRMRVGGTSINTSTVYNTHTLQGNGSSASSNAFGGTASTEGFLILNSQDTYGFGLVLDILDYRNTNKNKTVRYLNGGDNNGAGFVGLGSVLWAQTTAIGSLQFYTQAGNFNANSTFALYGINA